MAGTPIRKLLVIGCSQTKRDTDGLLPAIHRYDGSPYRVLRNYLRGHEWPASLSVAILSARHGLVGGFTEIEDYDERMTSARAQEWAPSCVETLNKWSSHHQSVHFSLGKDYLPAITPAIETGKWRKAEMFAGPIGIKLSHIKSLLEGTHAPLVKRPSMPEPGSGKISYFLPDWDDLLDPSFDFETSSFSGATNALRGDKHCCVLMRPKRMCDGVLVSLAQQGTSKGPLKRFAGTDMDSLAPRRLHDHFGLGENQALFGDCGAFSYVNERSPTITVEQAVAKYDLCGFDYGASVDHIPVATIDVNGKERKLRRVEREQRVQLTIDNAERFLTLARKRAVSFVPVGVVQGLYPEDYMDTVRYYHEMGYAHIALGGLVPLPDAAISAIVKMVMPIVAKLRPRPWIHLFGIFRPKLQSLFRELRIDSFDSATYFRKAWLRSDQNYLAKNGGWYAAIRVPMTNDPRTRMRLESSGRDIASLQVEESRVMRLLCEFERGGSTVKSVLAAVIQYDEHLTRACDGRNMRAAYERTLTDKPWEDCDCAFCKGAGIHTLIFRGANRNKRRGAHNTLMLYRSLAAGR
jgi:Queuine tRNA-ribosyltransferase